MAFAPTKPWKLPFITTWGGSPNRNLPTNSAEEAQRDRKRSIVALTVGFIIQALQILLGSAGRSVFSLDKYLSWMSQGLPNGTGCPFVVSPKAVKHPRSLPHLRGCTITDNGETRCPSCYVSVRRWLRQIPLAEAHRAFRGVCL